MAIWTAPRTWVAGEVPPAEYFNTHIRDNLLALKDPPTLLYEEYPVSAYTTTVAAWTPVITLGTLATNGGALMLGGIILAVKSGGGNISFDFTIDGSRVAPGSAEGIIYTGSTSGIWLVVAALTAPLAAGSHEIKLVWNSSGGGTGTMYRLRVFAREVS